MRALGWTALMVSLVVHVAAAQEQGSVDTPTYSFQEIQGIWQRATAAGALDTGLVSFLSNHLAPVDSSGPGDAPEGGGFIDLEDPEAPSAPGGTGTSVQRKLPVMGFEPTTARELHRRAVLLERMVSMLGYYQDPASNPTRGDDLQKLGNAAHLELFMAHALFFLEGQSLQEKCLSYQRAINHARFLGWPDAATPPSEALSVPPGWEALARSARTFHDTAFASRIPTRLCEFRQAVTKREVEEALRGAIDEKIRLRVEAELNATTHSLADKEAQYATALSASEVQLPTREIFALRRAVEDSATLHDFVRDDVLMLERAPSPRLPLLQQLHQKRDELETLQRNASSADATLLEARKSLEKNQALMAELTRLVREIAVLPGLDASTRAQLDICTKLPEQLPPAAEHPIFVASLDTCLGRISKTYRGLKERQGSNPEEARFAEKVAALSKGYIDLANKLRPAGQVLP